ncbi:hypothetical protein GALL_521020 [mine drainage metagenome]|uniref:Uncharacterized protein n=1 Tax=mine drainage metagenome TaxID=410659 RepID=A0A1J5P453_9ZZZZ
MFFSIVVIGIIKPNAGTAFLIQDVFQQFLTKQMRNCLAWVFFPVIFCPAGSYIQFDEATFFTCNMCF